MSSFKRISVAAAGLAIAFGLSGCGFAPIAATPDLNGEIGYRVASLDITAADPMISYEVQKYLDQRVSVDPDAPVRLTVDIKTVTENIAVRQDDTITRQNILATGVYRILDANGDVVDSGSVGSTTAINATTDFFATRTSEREAKNQLAVDIGRRLMTVLYALRARS